MKRCPYCGAKYSAGATVCATDETPLEDLDAPMPAPAVPDPIQSLVGAGDESAEPDAPEGFRFLGTFDPLDADRLLQRFLDAGLQFQIDRVERRTPSRGAYRPMGYIQIFVRERDYDNAFKMMSADWKV